MLIFTSKIRIIIKVDLQEFSSEVKLLTVFSIGAVLLRTFVLFIYSFSELTDSFLNM